ncbi:MAG: hypothetical protein QW203_07470 [Thermoplasmatales archaeon]
MRGIYTYKITLSNTTSTATPPNLQVRLNINFSAIKGLSVDLGNIRFSSDQAGNNLLYAWLESAPQGTFTQSSSISSYTSSNVWVNLGNNIIPANGSLAIYMQVLTYTEFDGVYWGANPLWTSTYGQYDNGVNVFPYYQRWGGLSSLPSNWVEVSGTVVTFASTYIEIAPAPSTSGWYGIYLNPIPSSLSSTTTVWEFYGNMYDGVFAGSYVGTSREATGNFAGYSFSEGGGPTNLIYLGNDNNQFDSSTGYDDTNTNKIYSMQVSSGTSVSMFINNTLIYSTTTATSESPTYFNFTVSNNGGSAPSSPQYIYWLRTRIYPPNGTDPVLTSISLLLGNYTSASIPVPDWKILKGKSYVTVSAKGISNGLSNIPNDGADFGPDTPGTQTCGIQEACNYAYNNGYAVHLTTGIFNINATIQIPGPLQISGSGGVPGMNETINGVYDPYTLAVSGPVTAIKLTTAADWVFQNTNYMSGMSITHLIIDCNFLGGGIQFTCPSDVPNNAHFDFTGTSIINFSTTGADFTHYGDLQLIGLHIDTNYSQVPNGTALILGGGNCSVRIYSVMINTGNTIINPYTYQVLFFGGLIQELYVYENCGVISIFGSRFTDIVPIDVTVPIGQINIIGANPSLSILNLKNITTTSALPVINQINIKDSTQFNVASTFFSNVQSGVTALSTVASINIENFLTINQFSDLPDAIFIPTGTELESYNSYYISKYSYPPYLTSTTSGTTAGTVIQVQTSYTTSYKKFMFTFNGYENDTATNQSITFLNAFSTIASITSNTTGLDITATTTGITITAPNNTTLYSGIVIVEGY